MSKNKDLYLMLDYIQTMYFVSIEEILFFFTKKYKELKNIDVYSPGSINEYNRIIIKGKQKNLVFMQNIFNEYGVRTSISTLGNEGFEQKRKEYIKFKFGPERLSEIENNLKANFGSGVKQTYQYEPIILEIDNSCKYQGETIIFISYYQSLSWGTIQDRLEKVMKKIRRKVRIKEKFGANSINKYNRIFFHSDNEYHIDYVANVLRMNGLNIIILNDEEEFVPYRIEYIKKYYNSSINASFLQSKWRYEHNNGWFNKEKWDPVILVKKQG